MNKYYIKAVISIALSGLAVSAMAADRFIIQYKPTEAQQKSLTACQNSPIEKQKIQEQIDRQMMREELSQEKLTALENTASTIAGEVMDVLVVNSLPTGAKVIRLSKNLNAEKTKLFIQAIGTSGDIEYIEEDVTITAEQ